MEVFALVTYWTCILEILGTNQLSFSFKLFMLSLKHVWVYEVLLPPLITSRTTDGILSVLGIGDKNV
jgi:hypothetical protein